MGLVIPTLETKSEILSTVNENTGRSPTAGKITLANGISFENFVRFSGVVSSKKITESR